MPKFVVKVNISFDQCECFNQIKLFEKSWILMKSFVELSFLTRFLN
jgi:hypothetical protein